MVHEQSDEVLQWCGRELERGYRAQRFDAVATARILVDCGASSLPGAQLKAADLVLALLAGARPATAARRPRAGATPPLRVPHALDGLTALVRLA